MMHPSNSPTPPPAALTAARSKVVAAAGDTAFPTRHPAILYSAKPNSKQLRVPKKEPLSDSDDDEAEPLVKGPPNVALARMQLLESRLNAADERAAELGEELNLEKGQHSTTKESFKAAQAELNEAQRSIYRLEQQLDTANQRATELEAEEKLEANERRHEQEEYNRMKITLNRVQDELTQVNNARTLEKARANAVERELRRDNATLESNLGKHTLADISRQIIFTASKKRKRELEQHKLTEEGRLEGVAEEAREKWGWAAEE